MFATLLLGIVGSAILGFLTALSRGSEMRRGIADPAIESAMAMRRLNTIVPNIRCILHVESDRALLWISDVVRSGTVHTSEVVLLRFDSTEGDLLLETYSPVLLEQDRRLDYAYLSGTYHLLSSRFDNARSNGALFSQVLAEGLDSVTFATILGSPESIRATFANASAESTVTITASPLEEPLR